MPRLLGSAVRVVDHEGLTIDEYVGNVSTSEDTLSVAQVKVDTPTSEPWLTLHYDEWICVLEGQMDVHYFEGEKEIVLSVTKGQTCFIAKGERFRPIFPLGKTEYIPVCFPAFRPDRCIREEGGEESEVSTKLKQLHDTDAESSKKTNDKNDQEKYDDIDILYHMCDKQKWEEAITSGNAYYPPTFSADGNFIHATAVPSRLIDVGNHFYKADKSEWICLELSRKALAQKCGIVTVFEEAKPVGETDTNQDWEDAILFPHIFGGLPTCVDGIVLKVYPIERGDDGSFLEISGLTNK